MTALGVLVLGAGLAPGREPQVNAIEHAAQEKAPAWDTVRSVLAENCLECHGGNKRESELSFADASTFEEGGARGPVIDTVDPSSSRLLAVIGYDDPSLAMPPSGKLDDQSQDILRAWVMAGAPWPEGEAGRLADASRFPRVERTIDFDSDWWSYQPLSDPPVPSVADPQWGERPIDAFIAAGLDQVGLRPGELADATVLLRRARYDLTGLPPTPAEIATFVAAYEADPESAWVSLVDRLLDSPEYGEHWARFWLDQVRYAQTNGYERDSTKPNIWRYRDWVIRAFNSDMPYDEFLKQQLAGDELLQAYPDHYEDESALIATGYYRLGVWDDEPADPVQARADELADIVDTTGQLVLGMTVGCARCHDHKADPISQRDYYAFTAFFNNLTSYGNNNGNSREAESVRLIADSSRAGHISKAEADERIRALTELLGRSAGEVEWTDADTQTIVADARAGGSTWRYLEGAFPDDAHLQAYDDSDWAQGKGGFGTRGTPGAIIGTPWASKQITLRQDFVLGSIPEGMVLSIHHDERARVYINGRAVLDLAGYSTAYQELQLGNEAINALVVGSNTIAIMCEQTLGGQYIDAGLRTGWLDTPEALVLRVESASKRAEASEELKRAAEYVQQIREVQRTPVNEPYEALVVAEHGELAPAQHVLMRGSAHAPGDEVAPAIPQVLSWAGGPALDGHESFTGTTGRRLALAQWLVGEGQDLTARVMANKLWQSHFGRGIARSSGDFGKLGQAPTHPELLDHLARRLIDHGWSLKAMHREIMHTRAYRMVSTPSPEMAARDPLNEYFARIDPRRLTAEQYRDGVLQVSGQANPKMFGPAVYPPMAEEVLATSSRPDEAWGKSSQEDAMRRSVYVFQKRSLRLPLLESLDQPSPDLPCLNRFSTNVPTQALITLNGDFVNDAALRLAERLERETDTLDAAIAHGIVLSLGRSPQADEVDRYRGFIERMRRAYGLSELEGLRLYCLMLFNTNEFMWLD